jgi:single-strand DNA-binding protein
MPAFNRVIIAGHMTRDPELAFLPSGTSVCKFGLAINRKWRDKDGNQKEEVCFVDVSAFGKTGETINKYFQKGKAILVEGRLHYQEWTSKEGQRRSKLEVVADGFSFIESGGSSQDSKPQGRSVGTGNAAPQAQDCPPPADSDVPF